MEHFYFDVIRAKVSSNCGKDCRKYGLDERDKRDEQAINELTIEDVFNLTYSFEKSPSYSFEKSPSYSFEKSPEQLNL